MTPAECMHAAMLAQIGLTENQFKAMDPAAQQKIEDNIREMIKQRAAESSDKRTCKIILVPPLQLGLWRQRHLGRRAGRWE
jgi:hypothetical protein